MDSTPLPPEQAFLLGLLRTSVRREKAPPAAPAGLDWARFLDLLAEHRLVSTLQPILGKAAIPAEIMDRIEVMNRRVWIHGEVLDRELGRILPALDGAGIPALLLKGGSLAQTVYRSPGERFFYDLDLLVRRNEIGPACAALRPLGYEAPPLHKPVEFYDRHHFHRVLRGPGDVSVEFHWDLTRPADYFRFQLDGFRERSEVIEKDGFSLRVPSLSDQLLHAACQALQEGFTDLRRMVDAALLLDAGCARSPGVAERARGQGMAHILWMLLRMTRDLLGVEPPQELEAATRPGPLIRACLESLDLPVKTLSGYARRRTGLVHLIRWLCSPGCRTAVFEMRRFLFPSEDYFLDKGFPPDRLPGPARRGMITLRRGWTLARLVGYQAWRLAAGGR